jgi:hypothetical protein
MPGIFSHVEAGSNTSTVALRVAEGDEKGTQCLGVQLGHPITGGHKYRDLALQGGLDSRLTTLFSKHLLVRNIKE